MNTEGKQKYLKESKKKEKQKPLKESKIISRKVKILKGKQSHFKRILTPQRHRTYKLKRMSSLFFSSFYLACMCNK